MKGRCTWHEIKPNSNTYDSECGETFTIEFVYWYCPECGKPVNYQLSHGDIEDSRETKFERGES